MKKEEVKEIIEYEGRKVELTWHDETDFSNLKNIIQVYGVIFNKKDKILIIKINKDKKWCLPGGGPEPEDKSWIDTLKREVLEEA